MSQPTRRARTASCLFLTCWLVYALHFATNMVRENYLALAIGDHFTFRVDEYQGLHDDIFETESHGWHIGSNPGASMAGAIAYAPFRGAIEAIADRQREVRHEAGATTAAVYDAPLATDREFYAAAWSRGLDVKFALASAVMQWLCMAPISALGVVLMYRVLRHLFPTGNVALGLALLYAFGTPVFYRAGFLNHNMMLGHAAFAGFIVLWDLGSKAWNADRRHAVAGLCGGFALLCDYSGLLVLVGLLVYALARTERQTSAAERARLVICYALGALGPVAMLWLYQWRSFGHPFLPPQHWMPPVEWSDQGYQGVSLPQPALLSDLGFDFRYGLFTSCPLFLLAVLYPLLGRRGDGRLPRLETTACLVFAAALWVFFSGVHYTRWQFVTGIRYLAPVFPFLFLPAAMALQRAPSPLRIAVAALAVFQAWAMAMSRDVSGGKMSPSDPDSGSGVLEPILDVCRNGPQLPALTTLSRMGAQYDGLVPFQPPPILVLAGAGAVVAAIWWLAPRLRTAARP